ncbi:MAG TPA: DUF4198 domain-containing protein [Ramlibacter sp.]|nr:DUF4198 domain-containing protein [Ramlibacter sp.]
MTLRAALLALCLAASVAQAHDSWLAPKAGSTFELATGNRYPVQEFGVSPSSVLQSACRDAQGKPLPLRASREHPKWLEMRAARQPLACWAELRAADIAIEPPLVAVYLAEIRASRANRERWAALLAEGIPWRETYRKFARIEVAPEFATRDAIAAARRPVGLALELVVLGSEPIAVGQPVQFQLLRDGHPLAGLPVELVSERSAIGIWRETDSQGRLTLALPFAGKWLLRATDLRVSQDRDSAWESRFVTLAFEALPVRKRISPVD